MGRRRERGDTVATTVGISQGLDEAVRGYCAAHRVGFGPVVDQALTELTAGPYTPPATGYPETVVWRRVRVDAAVHTQASVWRRSAGFGFSAMVEAALTGFLDRRAHRPAPYDWSTRT